MGQWLCQALGKANAHVRFISTTAKYTNLYDCEVTLLRNDRALYRPDVGRATGTTLAGALLVASVEAVERITLSSNGQFHSASAAHTDSKAALRLAMFEYFERSIINFHVENNFSFLRSKEDQLQNVNAKIVKFLSLAGIDVDFWSSPIDDREGFVLCRARLPKSCGSGWLMTHAFANNKSIASIKAFEEMLPNLLAMAELSLGNINLELAAALVKDLQALHYQELFDNLLADECKSGSAAIDSKVFREIVNSFEPEFLLIPESLSHFPIHVVHAKLLRPGARQYAV